MDSQDINAALQIIQLSDSFKIAFQQAPTARNRLKIILNAYNTYIAPLKDTNFVEQLKNEAETYPQKKPVSLSPHLF